MHLAYSFASVPFIVCVLQSLLCRVSSQLLSLTLEGPPEWQGLYLKVNWKRLCHFLGDIFPFIFFFFLSFFHWGIQVRALRQKDEIKNHQTGKEKNKTVFRGWHDFVGRKLFRNSPKWATEWVWQGCKIQKQYAKRSHILYTSNRPGRTFKIPLIVAQKYSQRFGGKFNKRRARLVHWNCGYTTRLRGAADEPSGDVHGLENQDHCGGTSPQISMKSQRRRLRTENPGRLLCRQGRADSKAYIKMRASVSPPLRAFCVPSDDACELKV